MSIDTDQTIAEIDSLLVTSDGTSANIFAERCFSEWRVSFIGGDPDTYRPQTSGAVTVKATDYGFVRIDATGKTQGEALAAALDFVRTETPAP